MGEGPVVPDETGSELADLDQPRALPAALAESLLTELTEPDIAGIAGIDVPRPLPDPLRASIEAALAGGAAPSGPRLVGWVRRVPARTRLAAAAAAVVLLIGGIAVAADEDDEVPLAADAPPTSGPRPGRPSTTTTSTSAPPVHAAPVDVPPPLTVPAVEGDPRYARLGSFADCDQLLSWVREQAVGAVGRYGLPSSAGGGRYRHAAAARPIVEVAPGTVEPVGADGGETNVQEDGVDEPDLLEVGEGALFVLTDQSVQAVLTDGGGAAPGGVAVVADPSRATPAGMFLTGPTLLVLVGTYDDEIGAQTVVRRFDVADPTALVELESTVVDGWFVDARLTGGYLHLVTSWEPGRFDFVYPHEVGDEAAALVHNREVVASSSVEQWVPPSLDCTDVHAPRDLAGFATTLVTSLRVDRLQQRSATGLLADAERIYATGRTLVVSTTRWFATHAGGADPAAPPPIFTSLHRFSIDAGTATYEASGAVRGYLLDSYALDEDPAGNLRVAATTRPPWWSTSDEPGAVALTVLQQNGDVLEPIGAIEGLGAPGEQIEGVRFTDDLGFVVTFRRTDPLYVLDLTRPDQPRLRGALTVTGYSGYLDLLENGWLLGVGVEADVEGSRLGGAVSLYDIESLDEPRLAHRLTMPETSYLVEHDPQAIVTSASTGLVVLPGYGEWREWPGWFTAPVFDVFLQSEDGLVQIRRVDHTANHERPMVDHAYRAALIGEVLYTVSGSGVQANEITAWTTTGWVAFPHGEPVYVPSSG